MRILKAQMYLALSIVIVQTFLSCNKYSDSNTTTVIHLRDYIELDYIDILDGALIIPLEFSEVSILGHSGIAFPTDKGIFYSDGSSESVIYYFDNDGGFKNTIGSVGQGPGEYPYHYGVCITDDEVLFEGIPSTKQVFDSNLGCYTFAPCTRKENSTSMRCMPLSVNGSRVVWRN
jgi:hypothetical protein